MNHCALRGLLQLLFLGAIQFAFAQQSGIRSTRRVLAHFNPDGSGHRWHSRVAPHMPSKGPQVGSGIPEAGASKLNGGDVKSKLVVRTAEGLVMGKSVDNKINKPYQAFWSIPYAEPALGQLRFQSPRIHPPWQGIKMTTEFKNACLGYLLRLMVGDEDCLHLNVFVPDEDQRKRGRMEDPYGRPVVFWIHGGAFIHGSELVPIYYAPGTFTDRGFIFVSINYRLGPLGYLSTDDAVIPGNMGFKDQVMALRWVRRNIRAFGGDPSRVHIFGESSGGASVHALSISPMAQGLFASAMSMSGSLFTPWAQARKGRPQADHLARHLDCPIDDSRQMLRCLRNRGAKELTSAIQSFFLLGARYGVPFGAVVDGYARDPFLPQHPLDLVASAKFHPVPQIFGTVQREIVFNFPAVLYDEQLYARIQQDWDNRCGMIVYSLFYLEGAIPDSKSTAPFCKRSRELYFPDGELDPSGQNGELLTRFFSDAMFRAGVYMAALIRSKYSSAPTYVYSWDHTNEGALNIVDIINFLYDQKFHFVFANTTRPRALRLMAGRSHTDDMALLFDPPLFKQKLTSNDRAVKGFVASMLESFWRTGKPRANNIEWPLFGRTDQKFISFTSAPSVKQFLLTRAQLELFADWYDLHYGESNSPVTSMSAALGLRNNSKTGTGNRFGATGNSHQHKSYGLPTLHDSSNSGLRASYNGGFPTQQEAVVFGGAHHETTGSGSFSSSSGSGTGGHFHSTAAARPYAGYTSAVAADHHHFLAASNYGRSVRPGSPREYFHWA